MAYTTIKKPSDYFNTKLYTGNGTDNHAITGVGFQPDAVWIKDRDDTSWHQITDAVRGATKTIYPNDTSAETTDTNYVKSFDTDGFTVGVNNANNQSGANNVSWNWLASNTTASNTDGSITSTVSANTTSGFSIVSYTGNGTAGATVGHGLGVAPKVIIIKNRIDAVAWEVGHDAIGWTKKLRLNATDSATTDSGAFNNTAPTSSVFSLGFNNTSNDSGDSMIAYCFAEKQGFSKFGTYIGNGNADGPFVYTGFKPAFLMIKCFDNARSWVMWDTKRNPYNLSTYGLLADTNDAENSGYNVDLLSNGFKLRTTGSGENGSSFDYIYMAFAEEPLVGDNPATAR